MNRNLRIRSKKRYQDLICEVTCLVITHRLPILFCLSELGNGSNFRRAPNEETNNVIQPLKCI